MRRRCDAPASEERTPAPSSRRESTSRFCSFRPRGGFSHLSRVGASIHAARFGLRYGPFLGSVGRDIMQVRDRISRRHLFEMVGAAGGLPVAGPPPPPPPGAETVARRAPAAPRP